jgi:predicted esterase
MEVMRFELGRRLTRFERAWNVASPEQRADCVESMEGAVRSFFGLQLDTAAQLLDRSTQLVLGADESKKEQWLALNRLSIDWENPWIDAQGGPVRFRLRRLGTEFLGFSEELRGGSLRLTLFDGTRALATKQWTGILPGDRSSPTEDSVDAPPQGETWHSWDLPSLPPGDYQVLADYHAVGTDFDLIAEGISASQHVEQRMQEVQSWYEQNRKGKGNTVVSTLRWLAREMKQGIRGDATEIDVPWNAWLADFESLRDRGEEYLQTIAPSSRRSHWLQLSNGEKTQLVRLGVPKPTAAPLPVLFAFHGAGGSENMFFEAYGAGRLVELANERGWLVVSPRQSLNGLGMNIDSMLDELASWTPIDRDRVMLIGHSMGAAQAVNQASLHPERIQAVAALGGGGTPRSTLRSNPIPFFVAAGTRDFGRPRAKMLAEALTGLHCKVDYRDYEHVEHMVIVQAALDDVFDFLDRTANHPNVPEPHE